MTDANKFLGPPHTAGYRPAVFGGYMFQSLFTGQWPMFLIGEVEAMRYDPKVQLATAIIRSVLHQLKWTVKAPNSKIGTYIDAMFRKVWQTSLMKLANYIDYGHTGGEVCWKEQQGCIVFDQLRDVYPRDTVPLIDHRKGGVTGLQVKSSFGGGNSGAETNAPNVINLFSPRAFWVAHRARYAGYYGYSRFNGAWWPWLEKRARHGATDIRRTWYIKNAFRGMRIRHPPGEIMGPNGTMMSTQDYARQIAEKCETGGTMALPNAKNPNDGDYQWQVEDAAVNGDLSGVREYALDLDREILEGFEIPPEVVTAAETGSGWSGRSVPFMVFLSGEDEIASELITAIKTWIIDPGVEVNFGPGQIYAIEPASFVKLLGESQGEGQGGEGQRPGQVPQPNPQPPQPGGERPATAQRVQMSEETDRGSTENVSAILDGIIEQGSQAGVIAGDMIRRKIRSLLKKKVQPQKLVDAARKILTRFEPILASILSDTMLAGWLAGAARATRGLPSAGPLAEESPSLAPAGPPLGPPSETAIATEPPEEPIVRFPVIEQAAKDLESRTIMTREEFDELAADAKLQAFTAAGVNSTEALARLNIALTANVEEGGTLADFREAMDEALGPNYLSEGHIENIFRTNVAQAYSTGLMETLSHPLVADEFPYLGYHATHDSRAGLDHLAMEHLGLNSTNVYRRDDPIWEKYTPPWRWQCRCAIVPMSIEDAARAGVKEAKEWLRTGIPPLVPEHVQLPPFEPPPGWSTRAVRMSEDAAGHEHDKLGQFTSKGKGGSATAKPQKQLDHTVAKLKASPRGQKILAKGKQVAAKVKASIASGVKAALDAIDAETKGGISLIAAGHGATGAAQIIGSVFQCVHEEVFENALSQHSFSGAHAAAVGLSSAAVKGEQALLAAVSWAWGKVKGAPVRMGHDTPPELTGADRKLLQALAGVVIRAVEEVYAAAGRKGVKIDSAKIEKKLLGILRG